MDRGTSSDNTSKQSHRRVYVFNVIVVEKKDRAGESMDRLCINYTSLSKLIISDKYSLLNINEMLLNF